jgi:hypothetical protein
MTTTSEITSQPSSLNELIRDTFNEYAKNNGTEQYGNCLLKVLKKNHFWPSMQIKKYKGNNNLVLLHNTYKRIDTGSFQKLYEQCRSIILDFSMSFGNNVVVSYANSIPERISVSDYEKSVYNPEDRFYEAYDGTMITVYNYNNEWYFGTVSCPDANSSRFSHPTKKHGNMFDEVLMTYYRASFTDEEISKDDPKNISKKLRGLFTQNFDPSYSYEFILIHHENIHIINYDNDVGANYKFLFHVNTKNRYTLVEENIDSKPYEHIGVKYSNKFTTPLEAFTYMTTTPNSYGIIVKKATPDGVKLYKISTDTIQFREDTDPCNPNVWNNILTVYMKNRSDYQITDYINYYASNIEYPVDNYGRNIDPTYLIHTTICTIKDLLYNLYILTTTYYPKYKRFKMNKELDKQLPPIIQYHLAQLRNQQVKIYTEGIITAQNVYYYLCQCNNVKNIKTLIQFFASNTGYDIPPRSAMCFTILNNLLA